MNRLKKHAPVINIVIGLLWLILGITDSGGALRIAKVALGVAFILIGAVSAAQSRKNTD